MFSWTNAAVLNLPLGEIETVISTKKLDLPIDRLHIIGSVLQKTFCKNKWYYLPQSHIAIAKGHSGNVWMTILVDEIPIYTMPFVLDCSTSHVTVSWFRDQVVSPERLVKT